MLKDPPETIITGSSSHAITRGTATPEDEARFSKAIKEAMRMNSDSLIDTSVIRPTESSKLSEHQ